MNLGALSARYIGNKLGLAGRDDAGERWAIDAPLVGIQHFMDEGGEHMTRLDFRVADRVVQVTLPSTFEIGG